VYYSNEKSAIYIPRGDATAPSELVALLEEPPLSTLVATLRNAKADIQPITLRGILSQQLQPYTDEQLAAALVIQGAETEEQEEVELDDDANAAFRRAEHEVLRESRRESQLHIEEADLSEYGDTVANHFSKVMLVHKLRETRAFAGFSRIRTESPLPLGEQKAMLRRVPPQHGDRWLPAYVVHGEGIFVMLDQEKLTEWESRPSVVERAERLEGLYGTAQQQMGLGDRELSPRFLLIHTLSHLLINELTFECGYSSASLRERLYVSTADEAPMAAFLLYTAAGDADGTLGGLVRMAKPDYFGRVLLKAVERAKWCSADPVCMELGSSSGQGPLSCNLAACHNCALLPETACEEFNRFLDRAFVVGDLADKSLGFFVE
jgi:hypothetical protein